MQASAFHQPESVAEAAAILAADPEARPLAGGATLVAMMNAELVRPSALVSLRRIAGLVGIAGDDAGWVRVGAMTPHRASAAAAAGLAGGQRVLASAAGQIANPVVRNMGTIGGSIANADPAACYPAAVLGLGATVNTDRRSIPADSFFTGMYETALQPGELIVSVSFPVPQKAAYIKYKQPASRFALVGVFVSQGAGGVRVAVTGAKSSVFRASAIEAALNASFTPAAAKAVKLPADDMNSDLHGSAAYRAAMVSVMAARAVEKALSR